MRYDDDMNDTLLRELDDLLLLEDDEYERLDLFLEAQELIAQLHASDTPALLALWQQRPLQWQQRLSEASSQISAGVLEQLLTGLLRLASPPWAIFTLMHRLPAVATDNALADSVLDFAERTWHASGPKQHRQIQMSAWSCGLSGRLRRRLGYGAWKDAGL